MLYILAIIMGFFLGCGFTLIVKSSDSPKTTNYMRRGILEKSFQVTNPSGVYQVDVQFEVGELERTSTKSKIEVISTYPAQSRFNSERDKSEFKELTNHTWIDSNQFEWIEDNVSEKRNQKIDEILS